MFIAGANPFGNLERQLEIDGTAYKYYDLPSFGKTYGKRHI